MRFEQGCDLLDHAKLFHRQVSEFYVDLAGHEEGKRVKLLLKHLGRQEKHLEESLAEYEDGASRQLLDSWFQFTHDESTLKMPEINEIKTDMTVADVIRIGLALDDRLIEFYKESADSAEIPEVREVFENLLEMEEEEKHTLVRAALESIDI